MNWNGWTLDRVLVLFIGAAFLLLWAQVFLFHYRQNFHHKSMYIPVVVAPLLALSAVGLAFYNVPWLIAIYTTLSILGLLSGLVGTYYHYKGVGVRVGGYELRNFLIGPPVTLPIVFSALSVLGLFAIYW
jgi:hypothetical protein